ncbi:MAG: hypothetical protein AAFY65_01305 [Pseudomonadota bacterium]
MDDRQTGLGALSEADAKSLSAEEGVASLESADTLPDLSSPDFPGPVAEALYWDDATVTAIQGPVGSGKTTTVLKSRLRRATMMPKSVIDGVRHYKLTLSRETYRQLWSTTITDFLSVYPKSMGTWSGGRNGPVEFVMPFEDEHGPIIFTANFMAFGDDIVAALRGLQTTDWMLHEMDTNPKDVMPNAVARINRYPARRHFAGYPPEFQSYGQIVGDMNAPEEDNWSVRTFHNQKARETIAADLSKGLPKGTPPIRINFHRQPGYDEDGTENLQNLSPGYYEAQIALNKLNGRGDVTRRMVYNQITHIKVGDPVFEDEWNERIHVAPQELVPDPNRKLLLGLDQGFKGAALLAQFFEPFHWQIFDCVFFADKRLLARQFGRRLAERLDTPRFANLQVECGYGDMAGESGSSVADDENANWNLIVGREAGFRIRPQRIGFNRIGPRLEAVRAGLEFVQNGRPGLLICPTVRPLIAAFSARYVWAEEINARGDKIKTPDKSQPEANPMDALQYLMLSKHRANGLPPAEAGGRAAAEAAYAQFAASKGPQGLTTGYDITDPYQ